MVVGDAFCGVGRANHNGNCDEAHDIVITTSAESKNIYLEEGFTSPTFSTSDNAAAISTKCGPSLSFNFEI